jgi:outer membrane protein assembly factor BamA
VNVLYDVNLGRHARLGDIEITGPAPSETAELEKALHSFRARLHGENLKRGQSYDPDRIAKAQRLLQQRLGKENHLAGRINLVPPMYDAETNRAKLHFEVTPGPVVVLRVLGTHISDKKLHALLPIYQENAVDEELVQEGAQNIAAYLQTKGFFDAQVTGESRGDSDPVLTYSVERGGRYRLVSVDIAGNNHIPKSGLMDQVVLRKARFRFLTHGKFNDDLLDRSTKNLEAYYRNQGYEDAKVTPRVVDAEPKVYVTFQVNEGTQTLVQSIEVQGNRTQLLSTLAPGGLAIKPGQPYSQTSVDQDRSRLTATYLTLGYPNATFRSTLSRVANDRHRVQVTYVIDEGPRVGVSHVISTGQSHTQTALISRTAMVQPATDLSERKLLAAESELFNLGIFDWDNVSPRKAVTDQSAEDVLVRVHEAQRNTIRYGVGFESTPRSGSLSTGVLILPGLPTTTLPKGFTVNEKTIISPLGSIEYSRLNMRGRAETASVSALVSRLDQKGTFTYSDPHFRSLNWSSLFTLSMERTTQNPLFRARIGQASFQIERPLNAAKTKRLQLRYTYGRTSLTDLLIENFVPIQDQ